MNCKNLCAPMSPPNYCLSSQMCVAESLRVAHLPLTNIAATHIYDQAPKTQSEGMKEEVVAAED